jgi:CxxC motif-containing protein (DUF1111 family)
MKASSAVAVLSVCLWAIACSAAPPRPAPVAPTAEAPTGFDNKSNGVADDATHSADQAKFEEIEAIADGLGPLFNAQSCRECHQNPVSGGSSQILELRAGHKGKDGSFQNPEIPINGGSEVIKGRSLVNQRGICPNVAFPTTEIQERVPDTENIRTFRTSVTLLGGGFVEALDDAALIELSKRQCHKSSGRICGVVLNVPVLESPGTTRVGRFGWKNQQASLLSFAGDAYLNEMGITNPLFPDEVTNLCNTVAEPNDKPAADGLSDIDHFARFVRSTKAPARDARQAATPAAKKGVALFSSIGCDACHVPTLTTAPAGTVVNGGKFTVPDALGNKTFHPWSDFLLHDVGTGDGIVVAMQEHYGKHMYDIKWKNLSLETFRSTANRMRTAPLWGVRFRPMLMHDGASLTFREAILRHRGEASEVTRRFERLRPEDQDAIVELLTSL